MIYFLHADISLVWLPSAQRQPPVHRPFCIYAVIITKRDLDRIVPLIYKEHSLPSGIKKLQEALNRLKKHGMLVQDFISSCQTESKRKPETLKKEYRFLWQQNKKNKKRHLIVSYFLDNVLLGCSGLDWVMFNLFQQHAGLSQREHDITPLSSTWYTRSSKFSRFKCSMQLGANVNPQLEILASVRPWLRR